MACNLDNIDRIPKTIIQTWKTSDIGGIIGNLIQKLKSNNPEFEYKFFDDQDIINFISEKYPQYLNTFNGFEYNIQKIDFFRYLAIYHYGGFYFDIDMDINKNISELCKYECVFPKESNLNPSNNPFIANQGLNIIIGNYGFGASKHNEFLKLCIENILSQRIKNIDIPNNDIRYKPYISNTLSQMLKLESYMKHVLYTTGPVLISQSYIDYKNKGLIKILECDDENIEYPFGNYGLHHAIGTWKNLEDSC